MEAKAKSGAPAPKAAPKAEKKEPAAPRKAEPAPAAPAAPEPEQPPPQDGAAEAEAAGEEAAATGTDSLEHLKPFFIGGAVIAVGAIFLGVLLLARRN